MSGTLLSVPFSGLEDLASQVVRRQELGPCYVRQWFRYALGRKEEPVDKCALGAIEASFLAGQQRTRELLLAIVRSPTFRSMRVTTRRP